MSGHSACKLLCPAIKMLFICVLCLPLLSKGQSFLPTIFWDPLSPALHPAHWSKVVDVKKYQTLTFVCPNNDISIVPLQTANARSYYNLFVREVNPNDTNLDYNTVCDPEQSHYVFSCNKTRNTHIDFKKTGTSRQLLIARQHANRKEPKFNAGMDYIFFSTSNGLQNSLKTNSTKCTMVFRIHVCKSDEPCALPLCSTFGREEVCVRKSSLSNAPRDLHVTNNTSSSLSISWQPPLNTDNAVAHYSICYRTNTSKACQTKLVESNAKSAILENLNASTEYFIRVRAVACKGPGNYSEEVSYKTLDDPVTSEPKQVTSSNITTSSVTISWQTPDVIVGDVIYYDLCAREDGGLDRDCKTMIVEPTQLSAVIDGLKANTSYRIRVRAHNFKRPGNYSEELIVRTLEIPLAATTESPAPSTLTSTPPTSSKASVELPTAQPQRGCSGSTFDSVSLVVGIVIGIIVALAVSAVAWRLMAKRQKDMDDRPTLKNITNKGFRSSVSGPNTIDKKHDKLNGDSTMELYSIKSS